MGSSTAALTGHCQGSTYCTFSKRLPFLHFMALVFHRWERDLSPTPLRNWGQHTKVGGGEAGAGLSLSSGF